MKVVFHNRFYEDYTSDPASEPGRMEAIVKCLEGFDFVEPSPAQPEDVALVHTRSHIERVRRSQHIYEVGVLAVGGAIQAARLACEGTCAFALIRPPGHHASPDSCWGFCYFNNIAVALRKLMRDGKIKRALILDFDLHFGDGTENSFAGDPNVAYFHPSGTDHRDFVRTVRSGFSRMADFDILAVSAGFDRHVADWGGLLETEDYRVMGDLVKVHAQKVCAGRRFAVLEGGYNHEVLGQNVRAFLEGMND